MNALRYLDATLAELPKAEIGTPLAREIAAAREHLLIAKCRLMTLDKRKEAT